MKTTIRLNNLDYHINLAQPLDISIPMHDGPNGVLAWYLEPPRMEPHMINGQPALVAGGSAVNFRDISFNPHAHVTHTEGVGHISKELHSVNRQLERFFFHAELISIRPETRGEDLVITEAHLKQVLSSGPLEAVVIRTLPNTTGKLSRNYSHTNPPYLTEGAASYLVLRGVDHLLIDLPSVDREEDGGALLAHKAFWNYPGAPRMHATITELIYVPDEVKDGRYFLNLQPAPFENDASPSRPILYKISDL